MGKEPFNGFPRECPVFYEQLSENNDKTWFESHKSEYEKWVLHPARDFIFEIGKKLKLEVPHLIADARINRSLFKIHRDVRFSKDKKPFKTHLGIWFWEGEGKRMDCSGFYFHIEPKLFLVAAGIHLMPQEFLPEFRNSLVHEKYGIEIRSIVDHLKKDGYSVGESHYKKVPRGFSPCHVNSDLLLHNSLTASYWQDTLPEYLYSEEIISLCLEHYRKMLPLHFWMRDMAERAKASFNKK